MFKKNKHGEYVKNRVYRVKIKYSSGESSGSGFFISNKKFITCFHVVFGSELRNIINLPDFKSIVAETEHIKLEKYLNSKKPIITIELNDGSCITANLKKFDEFYDIALIDIESVDKIINVCKINKKVTLDYGDNVSFGGFPSQFGYDHNNTPFAYTEGIVSSFPATTIGGGNYGHIKINSINLSGNSGAPLFLKNKKRVVGLINGNMNWGRDDLLVSPQTSVGQVNFCVDSLRVPLSIAYATACKLIGEKTNLFELD